LPAAAPRDGELGIGQRRHGIEKGLCAGKLFVGWEKKIGERRGYINGIDNCGCLLSNKNYKLLYDDVLLFVKL
jgi:hypothetical protein